MRFRIAGVAYKTYPMNSRTTVRIKTLAVVQKIEAAPRCCFRIQIVGVDGETFFNSFRVQNTAVVNGFTTKIDVGTLWIVRRFAKLPTAVDRYLQRI